MVRSVLAAALAAVVVVGGVGCSQESGKNAAGPSGGMGGTHAATPVATAAPDAGMKAEPLPELAAAPDIPKAPEHLPAVEDSKDNPTTKEKAFLGYLLFFDKRLSK